MKNLSLISKRAKARVSAEETTGSRNSKIICREGRSCRRIYSEVEVAEESAWRLKLQKNLMGIEITEVAEVEVVGKEEIFDLVMRAAQ